MAARAFLVPAQTISLFQADVFGKVLSECRGLATGNADLKTESFTMITAKW